MAEHKLSQIGLDSNPTSVDTGRVTLGKLLHSLSLSFGAMTTMLVPAHGENVWDSPVEGQPQQEEIPHFGDDSDMGSVTWCHAMHAQKIENCSLLT